MYRQLPRTAASGRAYSLLQTRKFLVTEMNMPDKKMKKLLGKMKSRKANKRLRTPTLRHKEAAILANAWDTRPPRASNLGCFSCLVFGHFKRECMADPNTQL